MRRGIGALFVAFLAVRVMTAPPTAPPRSAATAAGQAKASAPQVSRTNAATRAQAPASTSPLRESADPCDTKSRACPKKGLLDALEASMGSSQPDSDLTSRVKELAAGAKDAHFLIATVPDPVHTHLSLFFDRQIVAIEEAVQQGGYLFSRAYLPWDNVQHSEDTDFRLRLGEEDYKDTRENYPGVLVFHYRESLGEHDPRLGPLLVFLVAETPTAGINRDQFTNAIAAIEGLCSTSCAPPEPLGPKGRLFVLGPTFSGSFHSLQDIVTELTTKTPKISAVVIHSGTATDSDTVNWFRRLQIGSPPVDITFRTFEEGSAYEIHHLLNFICREGYQAAQVAVLSEDETAYGAGTALTFSEDDRGKNESTRRNGGSTEETCSNQPTQHALNLFFPRDISALRNAYQQDTKGLGTSAGSRAPRSTLSLNLEDHGSDDDSVAVFSPDQSPLSEEAVMMGILSDLREHRSNIVVIEATNPIDIVFLVRYLRRAYSDARIVTLGSDLLLPHQVDDPRLRGVMQVSSYSLIPEVDHYTAATGDGCAQPYDLNRIFPSDYSVGTFNALLSLMEFQGSAYRNETCHPENPAQSDLISSAYAQYGWPMLAGNPGPGESMFVPPLWLTMQGRDQFWPVQLLDDAEEREADKTPNSNETSTLLHAIRSEPASPEKGTEENKVSVFLHRIWSGTSEPQTPPLPPSWNILCALGIGFAVVYALLVNLGTVTSASIFLANFAPVDDPWRNRTLLAGSLVVFDILFCLFWPEFWISGRATLVFTTFAIPVCLAILNDLRRREECTLVIWSVLLALGSFALLGRAFFASRGPLQNFMNYRYTHIGSGVSAAEPILLLFAGCLWACWYSLSGRPPWDLTGTGPELPRAEEVMRVADATVDDSNPATRQRLAALTHERNALLFSVMKPGKLNLRILIPAFLTWALIVSGAIIPAFPHRIQSFEGPVFDFVYTSFLALIVLVLLMDAFCLGLIWLELRRLLMALDRLPLRRGFARMAGINSKRLWQLGGSTFEDYFTVLSKELHALTALSNLAPSCLKISDDFDSANKEVTRFSRWMREKSTEKVRWEDAGPTNELCHALRCLQHELARTCAAILPELNHVWNQETRSVWDAENIVRQKSKGDAPEPDDEEAGAVPLDVRLAEDFVCLFYLNFILSVFARMRSLVLTVAGLYVFLLLSFGSYPFEPSSIFHTAMVFLLVLIAVVVGIVYGQAHKNATLSWITDTTPGQLGVEFWFRLAAVVSVPLLSFLAVKFPEISGFLFSWLEPASQAFR